MGTRVAPATGMMQSSICSRSKRSRASSLIRAACCVLRAACLLLACYFATLLLASCVVRLTTSTRLWPLRHAGRRACSSHESMASCGEQPSREQIGSSSDRAAASSPAGPAPPTCVGSKRAQPSAGPPSGGVSQHSGTRALGHSGTPQAAAPSFGQPRPISRLGRRMHAGRPSLG